MKAHSSNNGVTKLGGAVVPLVTPLDGEGGVDFAALDRLIESQIAAGVEGILLLGTTGEGPSIPRSMRLPLLRRAVATSNGRLRVYANIAENSLRDAMESAACYFAEGADAVAVLPPHYFPAGAAGLTNWFEEILGAATGPVLLYNIPATTRVSIPLEVLDNLAGHPCLAGIKDSENNPDRHQELLARFGGRPDFSIFIGVGALMSAGLKSGADGIVPSVGNLIPNDCQLQVIAARRGDFLLVDSLAVRLARVASVYQDHRTLGESLAALKAMLHIRGLCSPRVFPPLQEIDGAAIDALREPLSQLGLS
jgi:dihydrodipicolinate synthase/N-acetylneuraminate lyase